MMNGEDDGHVGEFIGEVIQHLPISLIRVVSGMEISPIKGLLKMLLLYIQTTAYSV